MVSPFLLAFSCLMELLRLDEKYVCPLWGGCNTLVNPENGKELRIRTGCTNMPAKGQKFCKVCVKMLVKHKENLPKSRDLGPHHVEEMVSDLPKGVLILEEIFNEKRNNKEEVLVKFLGDP